MSRLKNPRDPNPNLEDKTLSIFNGSFSIISRNRDQLGNSPFGVVHRRLALAFIIVVLWRSAHWNKRQSKTLWRLAKWTRRSSGLHFFILFSLFVPFCNQTQVLSFKKGVSNSATQDAIMNAHNNTQFTYAKTLLPKILKLAILASNASSSSTKAFEFPHTNDDSIFTRKPYILVRSIESTIQVIGIDQNRDLNFAKEQPHSTHERWQKNFGQ
ncbi:hypothetical protein H5410_028081, partial [Solanum commersonii]